MTKHVSDQPRSHGAARLREYTRQEREAGTHPAVETLRTRPKERSEENRKAAEFARIDRGKLT